MRSFVSELRRRSIFRVALGYLVAAWILAQVVELVAGAFGAPGWVMPLLLAVLVVGFGPAMILAWVYEITPEGVRRDQGPDAPSAPSVAPIQRMDLAIVLLLVAAIGLLVTARWGAQPGTTDPGDRPPLSVAVLPFVNMSPDPANEFFSDGITEELLNLLARVEGLVVPSRTSSFAFKQAGIGIPEIGMRLGVRYVVEGSVRRQDDRVRITVDLLDAPRDTRLWSSSWDRELRDIFAVQEEIARAILEELEPTLGLSAVETSPVTSNLAAWEAFLRGRQAFYTRAMNEAMRELQHAVELDPGFLDAWAYLGATGAAGLSLFSGAELAEAFAEADRATARVLAANPNHSLALAGRSRLAAAREDLFDAMYFGRRAAAEERSGSTAHLWYGMDLLLAGYSEEAVSVLEEAVRRDPFVMPNQGWLGYAYLALGRYGEGEERIRRAAELAPEGEGGAVAVVWWQISLNALAIELANQGESARAIALFRESDPLLEGPPSDGSAALTAFYSALANSGSADGSRSSVPGIAPPRGQVKWDLLALGDADQFFRDVETLVEEGGMRRALSFLRIGWQPAMVWLREDPRFYRALEEAGMVPIWEAKGYPLECAPTEADGERRLACGGALSPGP